MDIDESKAAAKRAAGPRRGEIYRALVPVGESHPNQGVMNVAP